MADSLRDLIDKLEAILIEYPVLEDAPVYDGEGNPSTGEIEIDNGDVLIYFEQ